MEGFWDEMHPGIPSRAATLSALASDDFTVPMRLVPLTSWGHTFFHYKEWAQGAEGGTPPDDPDILWPGSFEEGFSETDRDFYVRLSEELERCSSSLASLEEFGRERFGESGEAPPHYGGLKDTLKAVTSAAANLLAKKPGEVPAQDTPPGAEAPAPQVDAGEGVPGEPGGETPPDGVTVTPASPVQAAPPPSVAASVLAEPQDPAQAASAVAVVARFLRKEDPRNPAPYLLLRGLRWGEIRSFKDHIDPQLLEAPPTEERKRLRGLFLQEEWGDLLEATEEIMATEAGRGWLDLQRYAILASDHLGDEYRPVTEALRGALASVLKDLPSLPGATLMDDSSAASADTLEWLEAAGFIRSEGEEPTGESAGDDTDPEKIHREATFSRAARMVQGGDSDGAIQLLMTRADRERSERATFITRVEAAAIMVDRGETGVARPILDELVKEIDQHGLDDWEAGNVVARPLGLLLRCLGPAEGPLRQQIYERICRLDPLLARSIREDDLGQ